MTNIPLPQTRIGITSHSPVTKPRYATAALMSASEATARPIPPLLGDAHGRYRVHVLGNSGEQHPPMRGARFFSRLRCGGTRFLQPSAHPVFLTDCVPLTLAPYPGAGKVLCETVAILSLVPTCAPPPPCGHLNSNTPHYSPRSVESLPRSWACRTCPLTRSSGTPAGERRRPTSFARAFARP